LGRKEVNTGPTEKTKICHKKGLEGPRGPEVRCSTGKKGRKEKKKKKQIL